MKHKMTYLEAAISVLSATKRPMHYEQVAKVALGKGLIHTNSSNLFISFGSMLNREARLNPNSRVRKLRPGVFLVWEVNE